MQRFLFLVLGASLLVTPAAAAANPAEPEWGAELVLQSLCMNGRPVIVATPLGEIFGPLYVIVDGPNFDHRTIAVITGTTPLAEFYFTDQLQPKAEYAVGLYRGSPIGPAPEPFTWSSVWTRACGSTIKFIDLPATVTVGQAFPVELEVRIPFETDQEITVWPMANTVDFMPSTSATVEVTGGQFVRQDIWMDDDGVVRFVVILDQIDHTVANIKFTARALRAGAHVFRACVEDVHCVEQEVTVNPTVTILSTSSEERVDFRLDGVDCTQVTNLNIWVMGQRFTWNETWYAESLFVEDCLATIDLAGYSVDGRARLFLPDWPQDQVLNESPVWRYNTTGGYYEQSQGAWVRWLEPGQTDLPIWVTPRMGQNLGLIVTWPGLYRITVTDGNLALCDSYPCPPEVTASVQPEGTRIGVYLDFGEYYLGVTTDDTVGGLSFISFEQLSGGVFLPLISR